MYLTILILAKIYSNTSIIHDVMKTCLTKTFDSRIVYCIIFHVCFILTLRLLHFWLDIPLFNHRFNRAFHARVLNPQSFACQGPIDFHLGRHHGIFKFVHKEILYGPLPPWSGDRCHSIVREDLFPTLGKCLLLSHTPYVSFAQL